MFINLAQRSNEQELMDDPDINEKELNLALKDISRVNRLLGGNNITLNVVFDYIQKNNTSKPFVIADLGCGDGEMLRLIAKKARKKNIKLELVGLDINQSCLDQAINLSTNYPEIVYANHNILDLEKKRYNIDILICTLTLHHFTDQEIIEVLHKSKSLVSDMIIVNDLQRSVVAYYLFKVFSYFFIKGFVAKNDGLISIRRGFKKKELKSFATSVGLQNYKINWKWAFRYRFNIKI